LRLVSTDALPVALTLTVRSWLPTGDARHNVSVSAADNPPVDWVKEMTTSWRTEEQAKKEGRRIEIGLYPWAASGRAVALGRTEGLTKILIDPDSERVLGPDHADTLARLANLAHLYYDAGRVGDAIALLRDTAIRCERVLPAGDPLTQVVQQSLVNLGDSLSW